MQPEPVYRIPHSPLAVLGTVSLLAAILVAGYAVAAGIIEQRRNRPRLVTSSVYALWGWAALLCFSASSITYAFLSNDFSIRYIAKHSDTSVPLFYKLTAFWGGLDGSLLFWVWVLAMFAAVAVFMNRKKHRDMI